MPITILIVESHDAVRQALRDWLNMVFPRYHLLEAASGEEAIDLIQMEAPHLIVTDISISGVSGLEVTRRMKTALPSVSIVVVSPYDDDIYRATAKAFGANAYVPKHAILTELIPTLDALLTDAQD